MGLCDSQTIIKTELDPGFAKSIPLKDHNELSRSVCKIILRKVKHTATGFFLYDFDKNCLLTTNYHVIAPKTVEQNPIISIEIYNGKVFDLNLSSYQNYIQYWSTLDVTIININNLKELCNCVLFLEIDLNYKKGYQVYYNKDVIILEYPFGKSVEYCPGKITQIIDKEFKHICCTNSGASGSPIILASNLNVIGIHKAGIIAERNNLGTFIGAVMDDKLFNSLNITNNSKNIVLSNKNKINTNTNNNNNYIIAKFKIDLKEINQNIRIINSYEAIERSFSNLFFEENVRNESEIKQCNIQVEGKFIPFSYTYKFGSAGIFKIIYFFQNDIKKLNYMFRGCSTLINLDFSNFNTRDVTDMSYMFYGCFNLTNLDLSHFNTQNVTNMKSMFSGCSKLTNLNLSNFNTSNVKNMKSMFYDCSKLIYLDLSNFDTKNVTDMSFMFYGCSNLTNLDLSNFNTRDVQNIEDMFNGCSNLQLSNVICYDKKIFEEIK